MRAAALLALSLALACAPDARPGAGVRYWVEVVEDPGADEPLNPSVGVPLPDGIAVPSVTVWARSSSARRWRYQNFWARTWNAGGVQVQRLDWGAGDPNPDGGGRDDTEYEGHRRDLADGTRAWWVSMEGVAPRPPSGRRVAQADLHEGELYLAEAAPGARGRRRLYLADEDDELVARDLAWDDPEAQRRARCYLEDSREPGVLEPEPCLRGGGLVLSPRLDVSETEYPQLPPLGAAPDAGVSP